MLARFHELDGLIVGGGRSGSSSVVVVMFEDDGSEVEDTSE